MKTTIVLILAAASLMSISTCLRAQAESVEAPLVKACEAATGKNYLEERANYLDGKSPWVFEIGKVIVQFNGAGDSNRVYIGRSNRLEILVNSGAPIYAFCLGFKFTYTGGQLNWDRTYGNIPVATEGYQGLVKRHNFLDYIERGQRSGLVVSRTADSVALSYIGFVRVDAPVPVSGAPILMFSMKLDVSPDLQPAKNGFCVQAINYPDSTIFASGLWMFYEGSWMYPPRFNGRDLASSRPISSPVCFDIVPPSWQPTSAEMASQSEDSAEQAQDEMKKYLSLPGIEERDGRVVVSVDIEFEGDLPELGQPDPAIEVRHWGNTSHPPHGYLSASFPIEWLPCIAAVKNVKVIRLPVPLILF
jgi:hypothetical protein